MRDSMDAYLILDLTSRVIESVKRGNVPGYILVNPS